MSARARSAGWWLVAAAALAGAVLPVLRVAGAPPPRPLPTLALELAGPRDLAPPPGATVAPTFEALAALVADPNGPREIALLPTKYVGDLVVRRPIAIHGRAGTVLEGTGTASVITVSGADVLVEDVIVRRSGRRHTAEDAGFKATGERIRLAHALVEDTLFGVSFLDCKRCELEAVHIVGRDEDMELRGDGIKLWEAHDSSVKRCVVERSRDVVVWYSRRAVLEGNVVRGSRYGTHFMYAHDAVMRGSHLENNVVGIFVMYSLRLTIEGNVIAGARGAAGVGLGFKDSDAIQITGNWLVANTTGTYLDNTPRTPADPVRFEGNVIALNDVAVRLHSPSQGLSFHGNELRQNPTLIEVDGGGDALAVDFRRNHYTDYEGYDLDGDGVGDVAYQVSALSSELTGSHPALKYFHGTAALSMVDAVAHAMPILAAHELLVDREPLVGAPRIAIP